ncbi:MAG TPA: CDP-alcohol phosphatidyltransferase family protein [Thermoanaerobaculia bacterium]
MNVWRERLARWFDGPARACPLSPNTITIIALGLNLAAAASFLTARDHPGLFLVGIGFLTVGGFADAFDGIVARVQNKASRFGDFLDHVADRISDTFVAAAWMIGSGVHPLLTAAGIIVVMLNGYMGTQIEATWHERNYETVGRGEFVLALIVYPLISYTVAMNGWRELRFGGLTIAGWQTILLITTGLLGIAQRFALAARLERRG